MNTSIDCQKLVAAVGDAVIAANARGEIVLWNPGAERLFGHTEAEALGQTLDIITPERLRQRHWSGYDHSNGHRHHQIRQRPAAGACNPKRRHGNLDRVHGGDAI